MEDEQDIENSYQYHLNVFLENKKEIDTFYQSNEETLPTLEFINDLQRRHDKEFVFQPKTDKDILDCRLKSIFTGKGAQEDEQKNSPCEVLVIFEKPTKKDLQENKPFSTEHTTLLKQMIIEEIIETNSKYKPKNEDAQLDLLSYNNIRFEYLYPFFIPYEETLSDVLKRTWLHYMALKLFILKPQWILAIGKNVSNVLACNLDYQKLNESFLRIGDFKSLPCKLQIVEGVNNIPRYHPEFYKGKKMQYDKKELMLEINWLPCEHPFTLTSFYRETKTKSSSLEYINTISEDIKEKKNAIHSTLSYLFYKLFIKKNKANIANQNKDIMKELIMNSIELSKSNKLKTTKKNKNVSKIEEKRIEQRKQESKKRKLEECNDGIIGLFKKMKNKKNSQVKESNCEQ